MQDYWNKNEKLETKKLQFGGLFPWKLILEGKVKKEEKYFKKQNISCQLCSTQNCISSPFQLMCMALIKTGGTKAVKAACRCL